MVKRKIELWVYKFVYQDGKQRFVIEDPDSNPGEANSEIEIWTSLSEVAQSIASKRKESIGDIKLHTKKPPAEYRITPAEAILCLPLGNNDTKKLIKLLNSKLTN